jgi:hypothetical protein
MEQQQYNWPIIDGRSLYYQDDRPHRWMLLKDVVWELTNGDTITIPAGYTTDFASVPRVFRGFVWGTGRQNLAVLIHDWLYDNRIGTRLAADREMLYWLLKAGCSTLKAYAMYYACRIGGKSWWDK